MFRKVSLGGNNIANKKIPGSRILLLADKDVCKLRKKWWRRLHWHWLNLSTKERTANAAEAEAPRRDQAAAKKVAEVAALVSENKNMRLTRLLLSEAEARHREQAEARSLQLSESVKKRQGTRQRPEKLL